MVALSHDAKVMEAMKQLGISRQALDLATLSADALVETALHAVAPAADVVTGLRVRAASNRFPIAEVHPSPPRDEGTVAAYNELLVTQVRDRARVDTHTSKLREEHRTLKAQVRELGEKHAALEDQLREIITSRSWALTRPPRFLGRLARAPRSTSLDVARLVFHRIPENRLKTMTRRLASGALGWKQGRGVSESISRTPVRRRLATWAAFQTGVLSRRNAYQGIFIQSLGIPWDVPL